MNSTQNMRVENDWAKMAERNMRDILKAGGKIESPYTDRREDAVWKAGYLAALEDVSKRFKIGWR